MSNIRKGFWAQPHKHQTVVVFHTHIFPEGVRFCQTNRLFCSPVFIYNVNTFLKGFNSYYCGWFIGQHFNPAIMKMAQLHHLLIKNEKMKCLEVKTLKKSHIYWRNVLLTDNSKDACFAKWLIWLLPFWSAGWLFAVPTPSFWCKESSVWQGIWLEMDSRYVST